MKKWNGFDDAILGVAAMPSTTGKTNVLIYGGHKMRAILQERDGMSWDDALEYIDFNIEGAYIGEDTPLIMWDLPDDWEEMDL